MRRTRVEGFRAWQRVVARADVWTLGPRQLSAGLD